MTGESSSCSTVVAAYFVVTAPGVGPWFCSATPVAGGVNVWYSLGLRVQADGTVGEVKYDGIADKAGLFSGDKIIGVNGDVFSADALRKALDDSKGNSKPIHLLVQVDDKLNPLDLDYHDGQRYPSLVRVEGTTDYLDEITKPLAVLK